MRPYIWNYNTRTGLGEITFAGEGGAKFEILTGSVARDYDDNLGGASLEDPGDKRMHRYIWEPPVPLESDREVL